MEEGPVDIFESAIALSARGLQLEESGDVEGLALAMAAYEESAARLSHLRQGFELETRAPLAFHAAGQALALLSSRISKAAETCPIPAGPADEALAQGLLHEAGIHSEVAGLEDIKSALSEAFVLPQLYPQLFRGVRRPDAFILLHGSPGTGKTLLVEELASNASLPLLAVKPSSILSKWSGEAERSLQSVFGSARKLAQSRRGCLIFLDEIDAFGMSRGSSDDAGQRRLLTELLLQLTELDTWNAARNNGGRVGVIGATNVLDQIDAALLRRFRCLHVPLPSPEARRALLLKTLGQEDAKADLTPSEVLRLVDATEGYSGAEMVRLLREAAMQPLREILGELRVWGGEPRLRDIVWADFEAALGAIRPAYHGAAA